MRTRPFGVAAFGALLLAACGNQAPMIPVENGQGGDPLNAQDPSKYPVGPYGFVIGGVIPNLEFVGYKDDNGDGKVTDNTPRKVRLSDYYQDKNIKVLAVLVAAEWCGPCQQEQNELIVSWNAYQKSKAGVAYVEALIESAKKDTAGRFLPADLETVQRWGNHAWPDRTGKNPAAIIPFPLVADPTVALGPWYPTPAFPMQLVIKTSDMTIQWANNGYGPGAIEQQIGFVLEQ